VTLPVGDIERWSVEALQTVFHAAQARGQATLEASRQLSSLAVFDAWQGATAEARRHTNAAIRYDLDAHGNESLAVAQAAAKAAAGIEHVQSELRTLRRDAAELQMTIDPMANTVVPSATFHGPPIARLLAAMRLQPRLDVIVAKANAVDAQLATAIGLADAGFSGPPVQRVPSERLPDDPKQFNQAWNRLTVDEKDRLYRQDHNIGNHPGMPWDPTDHRGKDHYNRRHLQELQQQAGAEVDRMQHTVDEMLAGHNIDDGALYALQAQLAAVRRHLQGYQAVRADLDRTDGSSRYLGYLDAFGHVAVAIGNPDYAKRNAIFVPGTGEDVARLPFSDQRAAAMYHAARAADPTLGAQDVAITAWLGYDRPMSLGHAAFRDGARAGAEGLDAFEAGLRASHVGPASIDTVIGHSYGSTLVGAAASAGHHLEVDNVIAVGSPGMLVDSASGLSLGPQAHVYAMRAANDIIGLGGVVTEWTLGPDPTAPNFGAHRLAADPGPAGPAGLPSVDPHSSYWDAHNIALANMGAVIAGVAPAKILGPK
jgi:prefoldin subunit 5